MADNKISAQQRALNFGASTRQHWQMIGSKEVTGGAQTISFRVPKSRILAGFRLMVQGGLNATAQGAIDEMGLYRAIRAVRVNLNNGFSPIVMSGESLAVMNMFRLNPGIVYPNPDNKNTLCYFDNWDFEGAATMWAKSGIAVNFGFMLDIPLTLNDRDPVGMVLAQNAETSIDLEIDIADPSEVLGDAGVYEGVRVIAAATTYSIPTNANAFPDMSVLKVWHDRRDTFTAGLAHIKLPVGMIYRKLIIKLEDEDGNALTPDDINGNIELVLNTADTPYSINPAMLRMITTAQLGYDLPEGYYAFDFTYQGITNLGGSRDYIDCERVSEFTLRFNPAVSGRCTIVSEMLSRLV